MYRLPLNETPTHVRLGYLFLVRRFIGFSNQELRTVAPEESPVLIFLYKGNTVADLPLLISLKLHRDLALNREDT